MMHVLQIIMTFHFTIQKQAQSYRHKTVSHSVCLWYPLFSYIGLLIFSIFLLFPSSNGTFPPLTHVAGHLFPTLQTPPSCHKITAATCVFCIAVIATYSTSLSLCVRVDYHAEDVDVYASLYDYITASLRLCYR